MTRRQILRILDANLNRSREGLRVCEEIARFVLEMPALTRDLKAARHGVSGCLKNLPGGFSELLASRNTHEDVGRAPSELRSQRHHALDLFAANAERSKESLRVLEETSKLLDAALAAKFKKIRFQVYAIEKRALPRLEALRDRGSRRA